MTSYTCCVWGTAKQSLIYEPSGETHKSQKIYMKQEAQGAVSE